MPLKDLRSPAWVGGVLLGGVLFIALGARLEVPMVPVPMSLQTYAVLLLGGLAGRQLGGAVLVLYLLCGAIGLPVFAGGASGVGHLTGLTAGYLFGFIFAAILVGILAERGWTRSLLPSTLVMVIGHGVILGLGTVVLGLHTDWATAYEGGLQPFLLGGLVKSILVAMTILLIRAAIRSHCRSS